MSVPIRQRGFTYLFLLVAIAILGIGLSQVSEVWTTTARRQQAEQLNWIGKLYANAIASYYESTPGPGKVFPRAVGDLIEGRRFAIPRRHLREVYRNPVAFNGEWELIVGADLRIHGVRARLAWRPEKPFREWIYPRSGLPS